MNQKISTIIGVAVCSLFTIAHSAFAQGTAFTYQGRLQNNGSPANGNHDFTFALYDSNSTNTGQAGATLTNLDVGVTNGLFTVTLDFGANFPGASRWLAIGVRSNGGVSFTALEPLQELTPAPYAIYTISAGSAAQLAGGSNQNILVGPSDNAGPSGSDNTALGSGAFDAFYGLDDPPYKSTGSANTALGAGTLFVDASGSFNTAVGDAALESDISGNFNTALGASALLNLGANGYTGGSSNIALGYLAGASLTGNESSNIDIANAGVTGENNITRIGSSQTTAYIAGVITGNGAGLINLNVSAAQLAGGSNQNILVGPSDNAGPSGSDNTALGSGAFDAFYGLDDPPYKSTGSANTALGAGTLFVDASGSFNTAVGDAALESDISGNFNTALGASALLNLGANGYTGGSSNIALGYLAGASLTGNESSNIDIANAGVTGENNITRIGSSQTTAYIAGVITGNGAGLINLNVANITSGGTLPVLNGANLTNLTLNNTSDSAVASGQNNSVSGSTDSVITGGMNNTLTNVTGSAIAGGVNNTNNGNQSTIGGGAGNVIQIGAYYALLGSGGGNIIGTNSDTAFLGAGYHNSIGTNAPATVLGGGQYNAISNNATFSVLGGGYQNTNTGPYSVIPGGINNVAASYSFAAGSNALAINANAFVWSDGSASTTSTNTNSVTFRAAGGYRFFTGSGASGAFLGASQTSWSAISDRNAKKNFQPVDTKAVLDKLAAVPIQQWNYQWENDNDVPNIGPMAQDFKAAFYPGRDDKSISTLEFDGVELAAIQGLNEKLKEKDAEIQALKAKAAQVDSMEKRLDELEETVQSLAAKR